MLNLQKYDNYEAKILADSISPEGVRVTTWMVTFPRLILSEMNTHRQFSRNSASTRAIPLGNQIQNLMDTPFVPHQFGINKSGMQHDEVLDGEKAEEAVRSWLRGRDRAVTTSLELVFGEVLSSQLFNYDPSCMYIPGSVITSRLDEIKELIPKSSDYEKALRMGMLNVHKQLAGRPLEPYMWQVAIITATEVDNFFALRDHPDAQGEIARAAREMKKALAKSTPTLVGEGEWHLPLVDKGEFEDQGDAIRASVARTAAVSYRRHNAVHNLLLSEEERDKLVQRELKRHDMLEESGHFSPFEHQLTPFTPVEWRARKRLQNYSLQVGNEEQVQWFHMSYVNESLEFLGNIRGWTQYRKTIASENNFAKKV